MLTKDEEVAIKERGWQLCWTHDLATQRTSLQPYSTGEWIGPSTLIPYITSLAQRGDTLARKVLQTIMETHT